MAAVTVTALGLAAVPPPPATAAGTADPVAAGARPGATRIPFRVSDQVSASVDVGTGNLMVSTTDRTMPSIKGMQSFGLMYQSLSQSSGSQVKSGAAGAGWFMAMGQDNRLVSNDDGSLLYLGPDGQQGKFTPLDGSNGYDEPAGFKKKSLEKNDDGTYSMTDLPTRAVSKFNADGRLISVTNRSDQAITFTYTSGNVSAVTMPNGQKLTVAFTYNKLTSMTRPANGALPAGTATYAYDSAGRLASITRPAVGGSPASTTTFTYSSAGDLASITDGLGNVTTITTDASHRVTAVGQGKGTDVATTRFAYASATQTLVASPISNQAVAPSQTYHATYTLNDDERVTKSSDPLLRERDTTYTPFFDVASQTNGTGGTATGTYGANSGASLTKATNAFGSSNSSTYGAGNNAYDPSTGTDSQGNSSTFTYDGSGRPSSTTSSGAKAEVEYYADGLPKSSTDPAGQKTTYTEDATAKYITKITPPTGSPMGPTAISGNPATSVTNGAGQTKSYSYDDRYATTKVATATQAVSYAYDANGRMTSRTDKNQKSTYTYDVRGNLTQVAASPVTGGTAPAASTVGYTYDKNGNMLTRVVAGVTTKYTYDQANQLVAMTLKDGSVTRFAYNKNGKRTDTWSRTNTDNTTFAAHTKTVFGTGGNLAQQWTSVKSSDSNRLYDYSYCYAKYSVAPTCPWNTSSSLNTGKIQYIKDNKTATITQLGYDNRNRLVSATNWEGHDYAYAYDSVGNRTSVKRDGVVTKALTFNSANQISSAGFAYDKAGRRTAADTNGTTVWNDLDQSVSRTKNGNTGTNVYAGDGQDEIIMAKDSNTTKTFVYGRPDKSGVPTAEYTTNGTATTVNENDASGMPLSWSNSDGVNLIVVFDGLGRMYGTVGADGALTSKYTYDPFMMMTAITYPATLTTAKKNATARASELNASGAGGSSPWSTPGVQDEVVKDYWKRGARWHDTPTATWTSVDPITKLNDPSRANPYTYASNDPINQFDPAGRYDWGDFGNDLLNEGLSYAAGTAGGAVGGAFGFAITGGNPWGVAIGASLGTGCASGAASAGLDGGDGSDVALGCATGGAEEVFDLLGEKKR
ncbi:RHS repeat-associated core domain-containing protein [Luteipulveratus flavus]|uniref:RHS repeat-associated core domain-containing protein n=1 Tax=Luteipulveratus flavus TaxID=3031728 RepID=A0ABT6C3I0_9MICO|nr:RHS repeat-associated core domain-containing protein [Luteipulveratus sp. YIM 133296]MDF8263211.1 RHS repeat-associated core domain-containing protein [Luteipulveratus sp. YIM 133296]